MARFASAMFIAVIAYNAQCFAQSIDTISLAESLTLYIEGIDAQITTLKSDLSIFQNNVATTNASIIACGNTALQSYRNTIDNVLATSQNVNASSCRPDNTTAVENVQRYVGDGIACTLKVSNVGNAQYNNPISQDIAAATIADDLLTELTDCGVIPVVSCVSSVQTEFADLVDQTAVTGALPAAVVSNMKIGLASLLSNCFNCTALLESTKPLAAADAVTTSECLANL